MREYVSFLCWCSWVNIDEPFPYSTNRVICLLAISVATHVSIVGRMSKSEKESLGIMLAPCWSKITGMQFSCPCHFYPLHIPHFIAIIFILILRINGFLSPWLKVKPLFICCWHRINELLLHIRIWILQRNGLNDLVGYLFTQLDWYQLQLWIASLCILLFCRASKDAFCVLACKASCYRTQINFYLAVFVPVMWPARPPIHLDDNFIRKR
jgi:hypothetical protein